VLGTFGYMAPEQLLGGETDPRTNIFAVGVMVVETLSGARPFRGDTAPRLMQSVLNDDYHWPCSSPEDRTVDAVVQRCLAKDPGNRFPSASALRQALIPTLRGYLGSAAERQHAGTDPHADDGITA
jgi:serine/threonine-protein kinase